MASIYNVAMMIFWRIPILGPTMTRVGNRDLWIDTRTLEPIARAQVELWCESDDRERQIGASKFRSLFTDTKPDGPDSCSERGFVIRDYFEDVEGRPIWLHGQSAEEVQPRHVEPVQKVSTSDLQLLGDFVRDYGELASSSLFEEGPGRLSWSGTSSPTLETAVNDEEIRSFVTVFRRLYIDKEPANFAKAAEVYYRNRWPMFHFVQSQADQFAKELQEPPEVPALVSKGMVSFCRKRLLDVFIYTRFAHQPSASRTRQYHECLEEVGGEASVLFWLFLNQAWAASLLIANAGKVIAHAFGDYCMLCNEAPPTLQTPGRDHPGIGAMEKALAQRERRLHEKAAQLAATLHGGTPESQSQDRIREARALIEGS